MVYIINPKCGCYQEPARKHECNINKKQDLSESLNASDINLMFRRIGIVVVLQDRSPITRGNSRIANFELWSHTRKDRREQSQKSKTKIQENVGVQGTTEIFADGVFCSPEGTPPNSPNSFQIHDRTSRDAVERDCIGENFWIDEGAVFAEAISFDRLILRIDDPVFGHTKLFVELLLQFQIVLPTGRRQDLNHKIRDAFDLRGRDNAI